MPKPAMPIGADLKTFLQAAGLVSEPLTAEEALLDFDSACLAAVEEWERATGWQPFLAAAAASERVFDLDDVEHLPDDLPFLDVQGGLLSVTTLKYGVDPENPSTTGTTMTLNRDYFLAPKNAAAKGKPYTFIEFQTYPWGGVPRGGARSLRINGVWGYDDTVPDDAWQAVLRRSALFAIPQIIAFQTGGVIEWSDADAKEKYGDTPYGATINILTQQWQSAIPRYRRLTI